MIEYAEPAAAEAGGEMHVALTDAVKQAVLSTFTMICGAEPSCESVQANGSSHDGVVGIISFMGDLSWVLMLGLPRETSSKLSLAFAGFEIEPDSPDMGDVIGELANVLAGDIVAKLEAINLKAKMSLPTVARGHDVELMLPHTFPPHRMLFNSEQGKFWVKVVVAQP